MMRDLLNLAVGAMCALFFVLTANGHGAAALVVAAIAIFLWIINE